MDDYLLDYLNSLVAFGFVCVDYLVNVNQIPMVISPMMMMMNNLMLDNVTLNLLALMHHLYHYYGYDCYYNVVNHLRLLLPYQLYLTLMHLNW